MHGWVGAKACPRAEGALTPACRRRGHGDHRGQSCFLGYTREAAPAGPRGLSTVATEVGAASSSEDRPCLK